MDNSIADILATVTRAHETITTSNGLSSPSPETQAENDLHQLTHAWTSERMAPELLPYPLELMDRIMDRIRKQIENIEDRTSRMDAGTSFILVVMQTELERFKFLIRSFLRTRIAKIDAHPAHLLALHQTSTSPFPSSSDPLLSPSETQYLQTHASLLSTHYNTSFLSSFPAKLRRLDDRAGAGGVGMVQGPDLEKAVFVRCLGVNRDASGRQAGSRGSRRGGGGFAGFEEDDDMDADEEGDEDGMRLGGVRWGEVEVSCGFTGEGKEEDEDGDRGMNGIGVERVVKMRRGEVWMVRWSGVREAVMRGECELI